MHNFAERYVGRLNELLRPNPEGFVYISWKESEEGGMERRIQ